MDSFSIKKSLYLYICILYLLSNEMKGRKNLCTKKMIATLN
ncbi:hypothetical protein CLO_0578 [Clostridium botulinum E1 str. 'BoNT E Beluga']|nr:hypothetical protein CLO_0578 [Clostridium botulinum E1 str. 'BoNT E Beluga']